MPKEKVKKAKIESEAVTNFREYLRCKTVHPDPDYSDAIAFLERMAGEIGLEFQHMEVYPNNPVNRSMKDRMLDYSKCQPEQGKIKKKLIAVYPNNPVVLMTWKGQNPALKSILLNSHMDVMPVFEDQWKFDPFEAVKTSNGDIYARGTQDMKSVGIQYLEAIRRLKSGGYQPMRTVYLTFVPDEEVGGTGMKYFVKREEFTKMNIAFALDEGLANPTEKYTLFYGERGTNFIHITCTGDTGHGSRFIPNTCGEKLNKVVTSMLSYRDEQEQLMKDQNLKLGEVTTLNFTEVSGGIQHNVVPDHMKATFDVRIPVSKSVQELKEQVIKICEDAGPGVTAEFAFAFDATVTKIGDDNVWWKTFRNICEKNDVLLETEIFPAATDSRFLRIANFPCFGFSPMNNTPILLHDHNEFLNEDVFLRGIEVYQCIIPALADVTASATNENN